MAIGYARSRYGGFTGAGYSGDRFLLQADWSKGMIRDAPPTAIPDGAVWDSVDYLLDQPGIARKRGGTIYAGPALSGSTYARFVAYCPEFATPLVAVGNINVLYTVSASTTTSVGTLSGMNTSAIAYRVGGGKQQLIMVGSGATPFLWNGTTFSSMGGGPPSGCTSVCVYKTRVILAG